MIARALIVIVIFAVWIAFVACEIRPEPRHRRPDVGVDAGPEPDADTSPHGYFGREPVGTDG